MDAINEKQKKHAVSYLLLLASFDGDSMRVSVSIKLSIATLANLFRPLAASLSDL